MRDALDAIRILADFDGKVSLTETAEAYVKREELARTAWTVAELHERHFSALEQASRRPATIQGKLTRLRLFLDLYGDRLTTDIGPRDIEDWIAATKSSGRNRQNYESALQSLFNFAEKHGPGDFENKVAKFHHPRKPEREPAEIVSPQVALEVLHALEGLGYKQAAIALAVSLFTGLRTSEVVRRETDHVKGKSGLRWEYIDLEERNIHVPASLSKTRDLRDVPIPDNLLLWLEKYHQPSGRVGPGYVTFLKQRAEAVKHCGHEWPSNAARHSAGTYRAKLDGERTAAEMLGHVGSVRMFRDHYSAVTTKAAATAFFEIGPSDTKRNP